MVSSGKRKRDDYPSQLTSGAYFPQQDGSGDMTIEFVIPEVFTLFYMILMPSSHYRLYFVCLYFLFKNKVVAGLITLDKHPIM